MRWSLAMPKGLDELIYKANNGNTHACYIVGALYEGIDEKLIAKDYNEAAKWYQKAITGEPVNMFALYHLGLLHADGNGVEQNYQIAFDYFEKATQLGHPDASCNAYTLIINGFVKKDNDQALAFLIFAAMLGDPWALETLKEKDITVPKFATSSFSTKLQENHVEKNRILADVLLSQQREAEEAKSKLEETQKLKEELAHNTLRQSAEIRASQDKSTLLEKELTFTRQRADEIQTKYSKLEEERFALLNQLQQLSQKKDNMNEAKGISNESLQAKEEKLSADLHFIKEEKQRWLLKKKNLDEREERIAQDEEDLKAIKSSLAASPRLNSSNDNDSDELLANKTKLEREEIAAARLRLEDDKKELAEKESRLNHEQLQLKQLNAQLKAEVESKKLALDKEETALRERWKTHEADLLKKQQEIDNERLKLTQESDQFLRNKTSLELDKKSLEDAKLLLKAMNNDLLKNKAKLDKDKSQLITQPKLTDSKEEQLKYSALLSEIAKKESDLESQARVLKSREKEILQREKNQAELEQKILLKQEELSKKEHQLTEQNAQLKELESRRQKATQAISEAESIKKEADKLCKAAATAKDSADKARYAAEAAASRAMQAEELVRKQIEIAQKTGLSPLIRAIKKQRIKEVLTLMTRGYSPNKQDDAGVTSLHYAAKTGNVEIINLLLEHHANAAIPDKNKQFPVDWAKEAGHREAENILQKALEEQAKAKQIKPLQLLAHIEISTLTENDEKTLISKILEVDERRNTIKQLFERTITSNISLRPKLEEVYQKYAAIYRPLFTVCEPPPVYLHTEEQFIKDDSLFIAEVSHCTQVKLVLEKKCGDINFKKSILLGKQDASQIDKKILNEFFKADTADLLCKKILPESTKKVLLATVDKEIESNTQSMQANVDLGGFYNTLSQCVSDGIILKNLSKSQLQAAQKWIAQKVTINKVRSNTAPPPMLALPKEPMSPKSINNSASAANIIATLSPVYATKAAAQPPPLSPSTSKEPAGPTQRRSVT